MTDERNKALEEAAREFVRLEGSILADISTAHSLRGDGASSFMRDDDRDFRDALLAAFISLGRALASAPAPTNKKHPSHITRSSDASSFDEICTNCGAVDELGSWGNLAKPCPNAPAPTDIERLVEAAGNLLSAMHNEFPENPFHSSLFPEVDALEAAHDNIAAHRGKKND